MPNITVGCGVWPTSFGWFYLEVTNPTTDKPFSVEFGLLRFGPLFDPTDITEFFEAVSDERPRTQGQWPLRKLTVSGSNDSALTKIEQLNDEFLPNTISKEWSEGIDKSPSDRPSLPLHGTNPLFGTELSAISDREFPSRFKRDVYDSLRAVSTLAYDPEETMADAEDYYLERIIAIEPPTIQSLFVTATVEHSWQPIRRLQGRE